MSSVMAKVFYDGAGTWLLLSMVVRPQGVVVAVVMGLEGPLWSHPCVHVWASQERHKVEALPLMCDGVYWCTYIQLGLFTLGVMY